MHFTNDRAETFVPDGRGLDEALARTTHMAIGAHPDDIPIMALHGILECADRDDRWFLGVTVTDGAGSPRAGRFAGYTDDEMRAIRASEEKQAAALGEYGAAVLLAHPSDVVKTSDGHSVVDDLTALIEEARPAVVYTHDLADRHDTHVAVALRTIAALRRSGEAGRAATVYGCEVWRDLDWLEDRVVFDVSARPDLSTALLGVYDSQINGGKRYDLAVPGRRSAHATFSKTHGVDTATALSYAMDLTPLIQDPSLDPTAFVVDHVDRMRAAVADRIDRLSGPSG